MVKVVTEHHLNSNVVVMIFENPHLCPSSHLHALLTFTKDHGDLSLKLDNPVVYLTNRFVNYKLIH
jgi:hypothetical protein